MVVSEVGPKRCCWVIRSWRFWVGWPRTSILQPRKSLPVGLGKGDGVEIVGYDGSGQDRPGYGSEAA